MVFRKFGIELGFALKLYYCSLLCVMVLLPASLGDSDNAYGSSRATFYGSPDCLGTATGACGFGDYGRTVNSGYVTGVSGLYKNGTGCGACYNVRCKMPHYCSYDGVKVVVTDYGQGDRTDFVLSSRAYARLAFPNMAAKLVAYGVVDVEYSRVPCHYPGANLAFKVHEHSRFPDYLAILILYQAGMNEILAVEAWQEDCRGWRGMRKAYGAVWDMSNPPAGALNLRFQVSGSAGLKWVQLSNVIPSDWKAGAAYDTTIQLD